MLIGQEHISSIEKHSDGASYQIDPNFALGQRNRNGNQDDSRSISLASSNSLDSGVRTQRQKDYEEYRNL